MQVSAENPSWLPCLVICLIAFLLTFLLGGIFAYLCSRDKEEERRSYPYLDREKMRRGISGGEKPIIISAPQLRGD